MALGPVSQSANLLPLQLQNAGLGKPPDSLTLHVLPGQGPGDVSKTSKPEGGWKAGPVARDPERAEALAVLQALEAPYQQLQSLRQALAAAGPAAATNISQTHARYLLGERPSSPPQAKLFDDSLGLMQKISARSFNPAKLADLSMRCETFAKDLTLREVGKRATSDFRAQFAPATADEISALLTLAEKAKAGGSSRMASAIAAFLRQVATPEATGEKNTARQNALIEEDVLAVSLLSQAISTQFLPADSSAIADASSAQFAQPPTGASAEVKAMYSEGATLVQELVAANRKQFAEAYAQGDLSLQKPASYAVNQRHLEKFAGFVEKARNAGLIDLELNLVAYQKVLFPGLGLATAAEAKGFAPTLARIQSANQHFTGTNATGEERVAAGLELTIGARPSDPAKAKLYDSVKPILARQIGMLRGKPSLDALSEAVAAAGLPSATIQLRQDAILKSADKKGLLALVDAVNAAVKAGDTRFAKGVAMAGLTAFPMSLASNDPQMREAADRLATVWDAEPLILKACEPLLAKFSRSLPEFQRIDGEQTKVLRALDKRVDAEYAKARAHGRAPDATALKKLAAEAIATQQAFALKSDQRLGELFTAVERDQVFSLGGVFAEALDAAAKTPEQTKGLRDQIARLYGPKFTKFFDDLNTTQKGAAEIAGSIETIRRKADVASWSGAAPRATATNTASPSVSAQMTELAKRAGVAPGDVEVAFGHLLRLPKEQFDKVGSTMTEGVAKALYEEAKKARRESQ